MFITETIRSSYHIMRDLTLVSLKYIFLIFKKINIDSLIFSVLFQTSVQHGNQDEFQSFLIFVSSLLIHYSGQAFHFDELLLDSQFLSTHLCFEIYLHLAITERAKLCNSVSGGTKCATRLCKSANGSIIILLENVFVSLL